MLREEHIYIKASHSRCYVGYVVIVATKLQGQKFSEASAMYFVVVYYESWLWIPFQTEIDRHDQLNYVLA